MFDMRPERQEPAGSGRQEERNACAHGDDDDVIQAPCRMAEECPENETGFLKQRNTSERVKKDSHGGDELAVQTTEEQPSAVGSAETTHLRAQTTIA